MSVFHISQGADVEPAHFWTQGPLVNGVRSWQFIIKYDLTHRFHGRILGVCPSVWVPHRLKHQCGTGPLLEKWSTCKWCQKLAIGVRSSVWVKHRCEDLLVKGVRSLQLTIKHDLTHRFHDGHLVSAPVAANFWSQGPLVNGVRSWQLIIKHDLTPLFHGRALGVRSSVPAPHRLRHRCGAGPLLEPGSTSGCCQKLAIDYKT